MDDPTAAKVSLVCLRPIPKLDRGTPERPQRLVLGLDWTDAHTPMRAKVNAARSRGNAARYLDITEMTRDTVVDFSAMMSTPDQKRAFFGLCAASIVERINSFDATNARVTFISSDGKVHRSSFDENGRLEYTVEQRTVGYGEADLSVPLEMAAAGPGVHWELWTIDWDSAFVVALMGLRNVNVRLGKQEQPAIDSRKRGRPAYEILNGAALCDAWSKPGTVLTRMSHGKTDYTQALKPFGITDLLKHEQSVEQAIWIEPDGRFMVHPARFVAAVNAAVTKAGRAVYIGSDRVIHLTSRTAPADAQKVPRPTQMLHDELISHLWTVCYFAGGSITPELGQRWLGPDPALGGLRLWEEGLSTSEALAGATTPTEPVCIGITPPITRWAAAQ